jgi:hypothetical protein
MDVAILIANIKNTANIVGTGPKSKRRIVETKSIFFRNITANFPRLVQTFQQKEVWLN